jgi:outer membrane receptor protein involved in Fe transport
MKKSLGLIAVPVLSVVLVFCTVAAYAEEQYQTEVSADYIRLDTDKNSRTLAYGVSAEMFFAPVKTAEHPYAEAAFLEHIGSAFVSVLNYEMKTGTLEGNGQRLLAGVNYTRPDFPLAIKATYATTKLDFNAPANGKLHFKSYDLSIGNYFLHTLLAGIEYSYFKEDSSRSKDYRLFAKYVHELEHGRALNFDGNLGTSKSDDGTETLSNNYVGLSIDYFLNRSLSAGVGIDNNSGKDESNEGRTYSANVRYFFTPRLSVRANYARFLNANAGLSDFKLFGATLAARF